MTTITSTCHSSHLNFLSNSLILLLFQKVISGGETKSEVLSLGWNSQDDYNIRYVYEERLYLLRASRTADDIIFNFLVISSDNENFKRVLTF